MARAAGTKKGAPSALQTEVMTDEEWERVRERKGLVVVDVYSDWSGPCSAMIATLRKVKMEHGGDILSYALARNDEITSLERFRGRSEPAWMFLQNGKIVNIFFGAHSPNLERSIVKEVRRVRDNEPPKRMVSVVQRVSEEEARYRRLQSLKRVRAEEKMAQAEAAKKAKYENFLQRQMLELCEETAIVLWPWVFLDEHGYEQEKTNCPAYVELVRDVLPAGHFDIAEQARIQLSKDVIEKLFVESEVDVTEDLIQGLTRGKCMAIRLKSRAPPPEWPVPYPNECPAGTKPCPVRAIDDVENHLGSLLDAPPPADQDKTLEGSYLERHVYTEKAQEGDGDYPKIYPAVWIPPQARSKVHVFRTLFVAYMEKVHPYEEPAEPSPLCGFKFAAEKFAILKDAYDAFGSAIEKFGVFEYDDPPHARRLASTPDDFEKKVVRKTGMEIFVVVIRRPNDEVFLAFAGNEPLYATEDSDEAERMLDEYFPPGSVDVLPPVSEEDEEEDDDDEEEGGGDYYQDHDDGSKELSDADWRDALL